MFFQAKLILSLWTKLTSSATRHQNSTTVQIFLGLNDVEQFETLLLDMMVFHGLEQVASRRESSNSARKCLWNILHDF